MTEHIEPSHLDTPVQNIARTGISKRSADPNKERVANTSGRDPKHNRHQRDSQEKESKQGAAHKDVYQRQFVDTEPEEKSETIKPEGNQEKNETGSLIDVRA